MREASFIERNKEKWLRIEHQLKNKTKGQPDALASDYIELTNDLAYAQTFYPGSKTKEYLNELALFAHQSIYRDQKSSKEQFWHFFRWDVPKAMYESRKQFLWSLLIFLLGTAIGFLSARYDQDFVRLILGDAYVDQTIESIRDGNPAAIYGSGDAFGSSLAITINNVRVAFLAFAFGLFFSVGAGYILLSNGIMLGAFHYLFFQYGVLGKAMSAIWIHGTIEISVIIIAGGCGLMVGNSFLFPKSFTRLASFRMHLRKAAAILLSTVPFFIVAGFLEGFVSRHYQASWLLSSSIIFLSLLAILFYYLVLPFTLAKKHAWPK